MAQYETKTDGNSIDVEAQLGLAAMEAAWGGGPSAYEPGKVRRAMVTEGETFAEEAAAEAEYLHDMGQAAEHEANELAEEEEKRAEAAGLEAQQDYYSDN